MKALTAALVTLLVAAGCASGNQDQPCNETCQEQRELLVEAEHEAGER